MKFILTINSGSSSLKFALFNCEGRLERRLAGSFDRIGLPGAKLKVKDLAAGTRKESTVELRDHGACVPVLIGLLDPNMGPPTAIAHRIVHGGMRYRRPQQVDAEMMAELRRLSPFDPEHLPAEIAVLEAFASHYPATPQIACFDTAFHRDLPQVARLLPIPRAYEAKGVIRYGFHGLSYAFLMEELEGIGGAEAARGRVIIAHLGSGASMAAVREGRCIDTTMAMTPTAGLVMSTRTGDLDPGVAAYLARTENMTADEFHQMAASKSGLLGISETSPDIRDLLEREKEDVRAAEALAIFCQQAKKWIGALAAALGGLDTLIFSAGIGENSAAIRQRICEGLEFIGVELDSSQNEVSAPIISRNGGRVTVRVMQTDEELYMARTVLRAAEAGYSHPRAPREGTRPTHKRD
jgi:acetate kinase